MPAFHKGCTCALDHVVDTLDESGSVDTGRGRRMDYTEGVEGSLWAAVVLVQSNHRGSAHLEAILQREHLSKDKLRS